MILVKDEVVKGHHSYRVDQLVGSGAYAAVYRAYDELGRVVALKEYFPASRPRDVQHLRILFEREKYVLTQVSPHPLMPSFFDAFEYNKQLYLAQEFIEGYTLAEIIYRYKKLDRDWMLRWAINLCDALTFLHERCIVHHDLKPANLKIDPEGHLVVLDYGAAQYFGEPADDVPAAIFTGGELYGTEGYLPPEVEENFVADVQTDIFALGCILYEMVMGVAPEQQRINERNLAVVTPLTRRKDVNMEYVKLVTTALSYNTEYRYKSAQIFLDELRKISPPVPMVSQKSLYFGDVSWANQGSPQQFDIYNAGSPFELSGEVICKDPWLKIDVPQFRGRKRKVAVRIDPRKAPSYNTPLRGRVEVHVHEIRNSDRQVVNRADKWTIHCYANISAKPPILEISEEASKQDLVVHAARGLSGKLNLTLANRGELPADLKFEVRDPALGATITPAKLHLEGGRSARLVLTYCPTRSSSDSVRTEIVGRSRDSEAIVVPVTMETVSLVDHVKNMWQVAR